MTAWMLVRWMAAHLAKTMNMATDATTRLVMVREKEDAQ